jgi:hypothetical protein
VYRREPNWIFYLVTIPFWICAWAVKVFVLLAIQATVLFFTGGVLLVGKLISAIARRSDSKSVIKASRQKRAVMSMRVTPATQISNNGLPPLPNEEKYYLLLSSVQSGPYTSEQVQKILIGSFAKETDFIWREGLAGWTPISQFRDHGSI